MHKNLTKDLTFTTQQGVFNMRVGALLIRGKEILLTEHKTAHEAYYCSIGGRVKLNERTEEAVIRETFEEIGLNLEVDRLVFINENFFTLSEQDGVHGGERFHEIGFFYLMKLDENQEIPSYLITDDGTKEKLSWLAVDTLKDKQVYPDFLKTDLLILPDKPTVVVTKE